MAADEWDPETGLRIVRAKRLDFSVGDDSQWRPPPWHREHRDGLNADPRTATQDSSSWGPVGVPTLLLVTQAFSRMLRGDATSRVNIQDAP